MKKVYLTLSILLQSIFIFAQQLASVNPASGNAGQTLNVTITGINTHFASGSGTTQAEFDFHQASGVNPVNSQSVQDDFTIQANITIPPTTITGNYDIMTTGFDGGLLLPAGFHVNGIAPPSIAAITPSTANSGQTLNVTITGVNTHFAQGSGSNLSFEFDQGSSTSVNSETATNDLTINANISIPANVITGFYDVYVYDFIDGYLTLNDGIFVGFNSIEENQFSKQIELFPNPAHEILHVKINSPQNFTARYFTLFDVTGKYCEEFLIKEDENILDVSGLANGTYFIRITEEGKSALRRFEKN
jgi:hypothetical protein